MPSQLEILTHILRIVEEADDSVFGRIKVPIDGYSTAFNTPIFILIALDPWIRNNTSSSQAYYKLDGEWRYNTKAIKEYLGVDDLVYVATDEGKSACVRDVRLLLAKQSCLFLTKQS